MNKQTTNKQIKRIAVLTSGGDAPGMNAAIRAVVRTALAHEIEVVGIMSGFTGLTLGDFWGNENSPRMDSDSVSQIIGKPGTILRTSRFEIFCIKEVRATAIATLREKGIDALVVIGGNGSYQGAHLIAQEAPDIQVIGIPATIDNDIEWTMETIGFDTAAKSLSNHCDDIRSTAASHDRVFVIGAMGRHAGDLALKAGVASGAEAILIPEFPVSDEQLHRMLQKKISKDRPYALVIVAEGVESPVATARRIESLGYKTAIPCLDKDPEKDLMLYTQSYIDSYRGHDRHRDLRAAIKSYQDSYISYEVRTSDLGHAQRGGKPTTRDRTLATDMGINAVHLLLEGKSDVAVSFDGRGYVAVPFEQIFNQKDEEKHKILVAQYRAYQEITHEEQIVPTE